MWDLIINPMVTLMTLMYSLMGQNIVLAIVVLTFIIRMLMYPLFARQQQSTKQMQEVQPKLKALQEKYKDDREKLAQAQMELYKEAGVNPFGGCLLLFVQFPIFIALYQAIFFAVASTPFQLVDLSERLLIPGLDGLIPLQNTWLGMSLTASPAPPDNPFYALALPALVMGTTYFQFKLSQARMGTASQSMTNDDGTPNQAAAMTKSMGTIMPVMFGFISLTLSVGLSIYFITSNLVSIIQYSPLGEKYLDPLFTSDDRKKKDDSEDEDTAEDEKPAKASKKGNKKSSKKSGKA